MGLTVSHGCWNGGFSHWHRWCNALACAAGYTLAEVGTSRPDDYSMIVPSELKDVEWDEVNFFGDWPAGPPADPLVILLVHQDNGGRIHADHTGLLADRLDELHPLLPGLRTRLDKGEHRPVPLGYRPVRQADTLWWQHATGRFAQGLRTAARKGEHVEFT